MAYFGFKYMGFFPIAHNIYIIVFTNHGPRIIPILSNEISKENSWLNLINNEYLRTLVMGLMADILPFVSLKFYLCLSNACHEFWKMNENRDSNQYHILGKEKKMCQMSQIKEAKRTKMSTRIFFLLILKEFI